ncbi:unnamed protein product [Rotaria sp. Silwood1]|nr:unnamed protein product [Rotaria sp. Silwood1]
MNSNSKVSSSTMRIAKSEQGHDTINRFKRDFSHVLIRQKEEYEQAVVQLKKTHNEQICKLCNEIEKSSSLLHQYKLELDSMRTSFNIQEKQIINKNNESFSIQDLQTKNIELTAENTKLKNELTILTTKYQKLSIEMQDAQQYVLKMIVHLD